MPPKYSQTGRLMALTTPLGADALLLERLRGTEALSELFRFELDVLALATSPVAFDRLLGQTATVKVQMPQNQFRYFNGIVSRLSQGDRLAAAGGGESLVRYTL